MKLAAVHLVLAVLLIAVASPYAQPQNNPTKEQRVQNWLRAQDANRDGRISLEESSGQMEANFNRLDADSDGFVDQEELGALADRLSRNTANRRQRPVLTDEQVRRQAPDGVIVELNVPYRDGHELWKLDLARPAAESSAARPAIVIVHGGGWTRGDKRSGPFTRYTLEYAASGYVAINVNYRLDAAKRPCIEDVKCAVRWLRAHAGRYNIDPGRVGAYGNSAGAHLVAMLGLSHTEERLEVGPWQDYSSAVQAVAASATPTRPNLRQGTAEDKKLIAPMTYVSAAAPPFLLFHEASDKTVDVSNSDDFVKALNAAGAEDVTYKRYTDGSGHGVFTRNIEETAPEMARFFARTIGNQ